MTDRAMSYSRWNRNHPRSSVPLSCGGQSATRASGRWTPRERARSTSVEWRIAPVKCRCRCAFGSSARRRAVFFAPLRGAIEASPSLVARSVFPLACGALLRRRLPSSLVPRSSVQAAPRPSGSPWLLSPGNAAPLKPLRRPPLTGLPQQLADPGDPLLELVVAEGAREPEVAGRSERLAGHHGDVDVVEEQLGRPSGYRGKPHVAGGQMFVDLPGDDPDGRGGGPAADLGDQLRRVYRAGRDGRRDEHQPLGAVGAVGLEVFPGGEVAGGLVGQ